jgi:hypothetical protein
VFIGVHLWFHLVFLLLNSAPDLRYAQNRETDIAAQALLMGLIDGLALRLMLQTGAGSRIHAPASEIAADVRLYLQALQLRYSSVTARR